MSMTTTLVAAPTPLPEWIACARLSLSKEEYIACAVSVAIELTGHLHQNLVEGNIDDSRGNVPLKSRSPPSYASGSSTEHDPSAGCSLPNSSDGGKGEGIGTGGGGALHPSAPMSMLSLRSQEIVPENIMIFPAQAHTQGTMYAAHFVALHVCIQTSRSKYEERPQLPQRDACFALGNVLFELFAQGDRTALAELESIDAVDEDSLWPSLSVPEDASPAAEAESDAILPPALKKYLLPINETPKSSSAATKSTKAMAFLRDEGVPMFICQLVADLLESERGNPYQSDNALLSLEAAHRDLVQIKLHPFRFARDPISPQDALDRTLLLSHQTDVELYGRESELAALSDAASRVSSRPFAIAQRCEAVFLSGHSGCGKSTIIRRFVSSHCDSGDWFVLVCKFDRQVAPLPALVQCFDAFFGNLQQDASLRDSFDRIVRTMVAGIDGESFSQLREWLPSLSNEFRRTQRRFGSTTGGSAVASNIGSFDSASQAINGTTSTSSTVGNVGSGSNRVANLLNVILTAVCAGGNYVSIIAEDLQWSDPFIVDILIDFVQTAGVTSTLDQALQEKRGLLLVGSFRDHEVDNEGFPSDQIELVTKVNANASRLRVGGLREDTLTKMLSFKLCLPPRHTQELAQLVFRKTRGNPMYIVEFLRGVIRQGMMTFSVKSRRWIWDDDLIEIKMISDGVVDLLTRKLKLLPRDVIDTLKVASCFGQIDVSTIRRIDLGKIAPDLFKALEVAVKEGILEKAGPLYAFSHDMLQESTYGLIPQEERGPLHKKIAMCLAHGPEVLEHAELAPLIADQISMCGAGLKELNHMEREIFAKINLAAGKHSFAASSYEQARGYFESGISLLASNCWEEQYKLCLELYEMSVVTSFMDGKAETVRNRLTSILSNAKSFDDTLNSRELYAKFFASQAQYAEATSELLKILKNFGEQFPPDAGLPDVMNEIKQIQNLLKNITKADILKLPTNNDAKKMNVMKFLDLLIVLGNGNYTSPALRALATCRLITLTFEFGLCEHTISGLALASVALQKYAEDTSLAARVLRIAESLMSGNTQEHSLRARLTWMTSAVKIFSEPMHALAAFCLNGYNSAKIVGDVDNAMLCWMTYCVAYFYSMPDLIKLQKKMFVFFQQIAKHKRTGVVHSSMSYYNSVTALLGNEHLCSNNSRIEIKNNEEILRIAIQTQNTYLMRQVITNKMIVHCFFRDFLTVANLGESYKKMKQQVGQRNALDVAFVLYGGISALHLARDTNKKNWRSLGEIAVAKMKHFSERSSWNFENKFLLLQAELHYLNNHHSMAAFSYQASIASANEHKFVHEEALAYELYGIYLIDNNMITKGLEQLHMAMNKYSKWGAMKKVDAVEVMINCVISTRK